MKEGDTLKDYNKALSRLAPYSVSVLWAGAVAAVAAATTVTVPFALLAVVLLLDSAFTCLLLSGSLSSEKQDFGQA